MDPNATLDTVRCLLDAVLDRQDEESAQAIELAQATEDLLSWLASGGHAPNW